MTLISSVSGIRGTLGGPVGEGLTPVDVLRYVLAFGAWLQKEGHNKGPIILGRDARQSGVWCSHLSGATLQAMGFDILDTGLSTTPTTQMEVLHSTAVGGIMLTASHNPIEWNALKLINHKGECLSSVASQEIEALAHQEVARFSDHRHQGSYRPHTGAIDRHIQAILQLPLIDKEAIRKRGFKVALDAVNSTGGLAIIPLLEALGVEVEAIHAEPTGVFSRPAEPLVEYLGALCSCVVVKKLDLGLAVDPDVDRLAIVNERGEPLGEEYTLVAVADYVLSRDGGPCVSNLSSSRALEEVAKGYGAPYYRSAVGEVHVVEKMRQVGATIGGEGNGGVIYPSLHAGRDALLGVAFLLSHLARRGGSLSALHDLYPTYFMGKYKISLPQAEKAEALLQGLSQSLKQWPQDRSDGLRIDRKDNWIHLRASKTEPVLRIHIEAAQQKQVLAIHEEVLSLLGVNA